MGGPNSDTWALLGGRQRDLGERERRKDRSGAGVLCCEGGGGGRKPRNAGGLEDLGKGREQVHP